MGHEVDMYYVVHIQYRKGNFRNCTIVHWKNSKIVENISFFVFQIKSKTKLKREIRKKRGKKRSIK